jgi:hypothetical protein
MHTTSYRVDLGYTRQELLTLFDTAAREDVETGGRVVYLSAADNCLAPKTE